MKYLVLFLFVMCSLFGSAQKTKTEFYHQNLKKCEGKVDEKNRPTGEWKFWDHKGNMVAIKNFKDGQLHGECLYEKYDWEPSEPQLNLLVTNKNIYTKALARQKVSQLDTIIEKTNFEKDKLHGVKYVYDKNGNPVSETSYYENIKNGPSKHFDFRTGKLLNIEYYSKNRVDSIIEFNEADEIISRMIAEDNYSRKSYYEKGVVIKKEETWFDGINFKTITCTYENNTVLKCDTSLATTVLIQKEESHANGKISFPADSDEENMKEEDIYDVVDTYPEFPGGKEALKKYINDNYNFDQGKVKGEKIGTIYVQFIIEKDGSISNYKLLRGIGSPYDEAAKELIENMPHWTPGSHRGNIKRVRYNLPIKVN